MLFLSGDCSQPFFSSANGAVMVRHYQNVIFDNPGTIFFLWFQSLSETLGGECPRWILKGFKYVAVLIEVPVFAFIKGKGQVKFRLINSLVAQQKPQIRLMLFAALVNQASCGSLNNTVSRGDIVGNTWPPKIMKLYLFEKLGFMCYAGRVEAAAVCFTSGYCKMKWRMLQGYVSQQAQCFSLVFRWTELLISGWFFTQDMKFKQY